ncbi:MAG: putative photosynthetic complex assembly protein PuhE [Pseudomonadota bacterium]
MTDVITPILVAIAIWWSSTGALLWLVRQGRRAHIQTMVVLGIGAVIAMGLTWGLKHDGSISAAYSGFACGIIIWALHEASFLFGFVTGPRKTPCPTNLDLGPRFLISAQTVIYHELAIALQGGLLFILCWGGVNQMAALTFALLWGMRISSKLVVFLGAPNISVEMLPKHLSYLGTYFNKREVTIAFPIFITIATAVAASLTYYGLTEPVGTFKFTSLLLLAMLASLAVLEHLALVIPVPDEALWAWATRNDETKEAVPTAKPKSLLGGPDGL